MQTADFLFLFFFIFLLFLQLLWTTTPPGPPEKKKWFHIWKNLLCPVHYARTQTHAHTCTHPHTCTHSTEETSLFDTWLCYTLNTHSSAHLSEVVEGPLKISAERQTKWRWCLRKTLQDSKCFYDGGACRPQQWERSTIGWSPTIWARLPTSKDAEKNRPR